MTDNMKAIVQAAEEDAELRAELAKLEAELRADAEADRAATVAKAIAFATAHGFELAEADLVVEDVPEGEVQDDELAAAAGGGWCVFGMGDACMWSSSMF